MSPRIGFLAVIFGPASKPPALRSQSPGISPDPASAEAHPPTPGLVRRQGSSPDSSAPLYPDCWSAPAAATSCLTERGRVKARFARFWRHPRGA
jgi:hypothetical protein